MNKAISVISIVVALTAGILLIFQFAQSNRTLPNARVRDSGAGSPTPAVNQDVRSTGNTSPQSNAAPRGVVKPGTYDNHEFGIAFSYPPTWYIEETTIGSGQGHIYVRSTSNIDLVPMEEMNVVGNLAINTIRVNPNHLSPTAWFKQTIAPEVDQPESEAESRIGSYGAYTAIANELTKNAHVYLFSGTRVVEVSYPISQLQFAQTYQDILNAVRIK